MTAEQKALIEHAAALEGRSITDFVLTSVQDAAKRAIAEHEVIQLSVKDPRRSWRRCSTHASRARRCASGRQHMWRDMVTNRREY
ncbi:type II toxin-antitoxin system TacA family antitoxin [Novosphingobium panipatense]|uniref:type II toxin-antitoxin system TacA family antitoxin n=1 Tax=Novosphingobium panipatense TaxID=428991 RepID=UPI00362243D5